MPSRNSVGMCKQGAIILLLLSPLPSYILHLSLQSADPLHDFPSIPQTVVLHPEPSLNGNLVHTSDPCLTP